MEKGMRLGSAADGMEGSIVGTSIGSTGFRVFGTVTVFVGNMASFL
jgi:phage tail tape-measure protein